MGIRGLHICIKKTIPDVVTPVDWIKWSNCRLGIDIQCFMYRAISRGIPPIQAIAEQIVFFRQNNIRIIYIFDGKPPVEKEGVSDKRYLDRKDAAVKCINLRLLLKSEFDEKKRCKILEEIRDLETRFPVLSHEMKDEIKQFLYATGTLFICASCEADTLLAYWFRRRIIDAVISYDYDFIARGCTLLAPRQGQQQEQLEQWQQWEQWEEFNPIAIREGLHLSESHFRDLCVLMGSDYTPGLPIVPWKSALQALQNDIPLDTIWSRHTFSNWRESNIKQRLSAEIEIINKAKRILGGEDDEPDTMLENTQWEKWNAGVQNPELSSLSYFKKIYSDWDAQWWSIFQKTTA